jgi:thioester reductase-like protein
MMRGEDSIEIDVAEKMENDGFLLMDPVQPETLRAVHAASFGKVFLTGSTGYLGAYLLYDLLEKTEAKVFCLVRAKSEIQAMERVRSNLAGFDLWEDSYGSRIVAVPGDLSKPMFGLDKDVYDSLAATMDTVFHNGAMVNFSYPYDLLKKSNVEGTREVLRFSSRTRVKPLFYVSTIGVFEGRNPDLKRPVSEDGGLPEASELYYGYAQSKWVAEKLVRDYRAMGMPATVFRPGPIYGDSRSGALNTDDFFCRMIRACAGFNAVPDLDVELDGLPVDHVSRIILDIAKTPNAMNGNFNIVNPFPVHLKTVFSWMEEEGYGFDLVPVHQWLETLKQGAQMSPELKAFLPLVEERIPGLDGKTFFQMQTSGRQRYSCSNLMEILAEKGTGVQPLHSGIFARYIEYMRKKGYIVENTENMES